MKNRTLANLLYGLATGLSVWFLNELWIYLYPTEVNPGRIEVAVSSLLIGIGFGILILSRGGFFTDNIFKIKRGILFGAVTGLLGGICGFVLVDQVNPLLADSSIPPLFIQVLLAARWLVLALFIGIGAGLRDQSGIIMTRSLIGSGFAGLACGVAITVMNLFSPVFFVSRGLGFVLFGVVLIMSLEYMAVFRKKTWIRGLNGRLEGLDFELLQEIHALGTQSNDDINLKSYHDIRPSHAKLVRYYSGYSLVDNDPFWQTYVNFRNIKEQPLKNGDIIKVGKALFQYCTVG